MRSFPLAMKAVWLNILTTSVSGLNEDIPFPGFRFVAWNSLPVETQTLASEVGWNETTWNLPGTAPVEKLSLDSVAESQKLLDMGFTEEQYDCFVNHYDYYDWVDLETEELDDYFVTLGWNNNSWALQAAAPESENNTWAELNGQEQAAAEMICYFQGTWDGESLAEMTVPVVDAPFRYRPWSDLTADEMAFATTVGWTESTWNEVGTASHEDLAFSSLSIEQQRALVSLGFYEAQYDCHVNHYEDYFWSELQEEELAIHYETLGWTEQSWNGTASAPASDDKDWADLSASEKAAAEALCWNQDLWDGMSLDSAGYARSTSSMFVALTIGMALFAM